MKVREMTFEDLPEVTAIEEATFSIPWTYEAMLEARNAKENVYLVCVDDDEILGYCGLWGVLGEGNIVNIAVKESARRRGVATMLMNSLEVYGREKNIVVYFLEVRESNESARNLYKKCGYRDIGLRKNFYEKPVENAVVMSKITDRESYDKNFGVRT